MDIYSLLQENNLNVKYLIDRDKFELKNIIELIDFDNALNSYLLEDEISYKDSYFENALNIIESKYKQSENLSLIYKVVDKFLSESDNYYISQWLSYLEEIRLEDFENTKNKILVSTIHKSKGMEFDKVYLLVNQNPSKDVEKRLFYVGMTRAKSELNIIRYGNNIENKKDYVKYFFDEKEYISESKTFTCIMSLSDIKLGFNYEKYGNYNNLYAGSNLKIERKQNFDNFCLLDNNKVIGIFSNNFQSFIEKKIEENFVFETCILEYLVLWEDKDFKNKVKHPLCKIIMKKNI